MKTRYSKQTGAFYPLDIDYAQLPNDLIEVSIENYQAAMARPAGYAFDFIDGELVLIPPPAKTLADRKAELIGKIDSDVAAIYARWTRFESEYKEREAAAVAFRNAGYAGAPGIWVSAFATAAGKTNREAADIIIAQADSLRAALAALGAQRMRKYEIAAAADADTASAIAADIAAHVAAIAQSIQ